MNVKDCLFLILALALSFIVRVDNLIEWNHFHDAAFIEGEPLLTNFDGYYYLRLSRDILEDQYSEVDRLRAFPDFTTNSAKPPLLSLICATITNYTSFSLNWVAVLVPPVLGSLIVLPMFGVGWFYGGRVCGYVAALVAGFSHYFVLRSQVGWFDTDCLVLFFSVSLTFAMMLFLLKGRWCRYLSLVLWGALYWLFLRWWDQATQVVNVLAIYPVIIALIIFLQSRHLSKRKYIFLFVILCIPLLYLCEYELESTFNRIMSLFHYISKNPEGNFPNIGMTVSEQMPMRLTDFIDATTDSSAIFVLSFLGLILLVIEKYKTSLFMLPYLGAGFFTVFFAERFAILVVPAIAVGFGYIIKKIWEINLQRIVIRSFVMCSIGIFIISATFREFNTGFLPQMKSDLIIGMKELDKISKEDAVVWAWWNYGYAINYHANRATINDGSVHSGERTVYNAIPFATDNFQLAANFMKFYTYHGMNGTQKWYNYIGDVGRGQKYLIDILGNDQDYCEEEIDEFSTVNKKNKVDDDWCAFFFPEVRRDIYLFLNSYLNVKKTWFWMGTWQVESRQGMLSRGYGSDSNGRFRINNIPPGMIRDNIDEREFKNAFEKTVYYRLFKNRETGNRFFEPVSIDKYEYQIWKVR